MANLVSPGVQVKEIDLTNVVPSVSSTIGAMAGAFTWGPANEICTVTSETHWSRVGEPMRTHSKVSIGSPF
jgi:Phage tail sheath protein.